MDTDNSEFNPFSSGDQDLWLSNDPVPVVTIDINVLGSGLGDDGSVICAQSESCCWIFSTVTAPALPLTSDGLHPVSGNRQFGYELLLNGEMVIYTKGADRFFSPTTHPFSATKRVEDLAGYLLEKFAFDGADELWESFQNGIADFVSGVGGVSSINM